MSLLAALTVILVATVAIGFAAALLAWRKRPEPGASPLVLLLGGVVWWAAFLVFEVQAQSVAQKSLWSDVEWIGVVIIPVAWLLFALEYSGRDQYVRLPVLAGVFVIPGITIVLALLGRSHDLLYVDTTTVQYAGIQLLHRTPGPWYWVIAAYTYVLGVLGFWPLIDLIRSESLPFRAQSLLLLVGSVVPWAVNLSFVTGLLPIPEFDPTPVAFLVTGVAFLAAIDRFELFGINPTPNRRARQLIFDEMSDPAIVVDGNGHLVDMNEVAERVFERTQREVLGEPVETFLPAVADVVDGATQDAIALPTARGETHFDVASTDVTDVHGRLIGRVVTFHDVGDYVRMQQRLEVLNRVFRHNIRNETQIVMGYADRLAARTDDDSADILTEHAAAIADLGEKSREIITIFEYEQAAAQSAPLAELLGDAVRAVRERYPEVAIDAPSVDERYEVAGMLRPVFENVVENAAEHNPRPDATVEVSVRATAETVSVGVADNGPGFSENEYAMLEEGTETPLRHGSGLGLWLIHWGTEIAGGTVEFRNNEPTGTAVVVELPRLDPDSGDSANFNR